MLRYFFLVLVNQIHFFENVMQILNLKVNETRSGFKIMYEPNYIFLIFSIFGIFQEIHINNKTDIRLFKEKERQYKV